MKRTSVILLSSLSILAFTVFGPSCKNDKAYPQMGGFPVEVGKIFTYKCATSGCHNDASYMAANSLNLSSWDKLFEGSTSGSPVIPYSSDFSSLCYFINTYPSLGPVNAPVMPLNGNALSEEEVKTIKSWIDAGAPDINGKIMWKDNPQRAKFYVLNQGCDVVTVFDAATNLPMRYITVGNKPGVIESPHKVVVSPDGQYWYVVFVANSILQKYRTSDNSLVGEVVLGTDQNWNTLTITPDGTKGYCISWQSSSRLASVDLVNMKVIQNVGGFASPIHGSALNSTLDTLYITAQTGNFVYKVDTGFTSINQVVLETGQPVKLYSSLDPHEIMFSQDGSMYFVTCQKSNEIRVMNTATNQLIQAIPCGVYPQEIAMSKVLNKLYITCSEDSTTFGSGRGVLSVVDISSLQLTNYKVGYLPHGVGVNDQQGYVYVASRNIYSTGPAPHHTGVCSGRNGFVNYFDLASMKLLSKKTEVATDPYSISVKP
ncbi:MAG: YncE family protein [Bacteroidetes bacterium]|nr:YncE family protein [Bacteroidota bacterium]